MKYREVSNAIDQKAPGEPRKGGKERNKWVVIDGRKVVRVTYPKMHGGTSDIPPGTINSIRKQLRLSATEFAEFVHCTRGGSERGHPRGAAGWATE